MNLDPDLLNLGAPAPNQPSSSYWSYFSVFSPVSERVKTVAQVTFGVIATFSSGYLCQSLYSAFQENIIEFVGYYGVYAFDVQSLASISGVALPQLGLMAGAIAGTSGIAARALSRNNIIVNRPVTTLLNASSTVFTALTVRILLPSSVQNMEESTKSYVTHFAGFVGGVLGGYAGIRAMGSSEPLINTKNMLHCYTTKCIQTFIGSSILDSVKPEMGPITNFVMDQISGSLIYNAVDIVNFVQAYRNGTILEGALPAQFSTEMLHTPALNLASQQLTQQVVDLMMTKLEINNIAVNSSKIFADNFVQRELLKLVASEVECLCRQYRFTPNNMLRRKLTRELEPLLQEVLRVQEEHIHVVATGIDPALRALVNATNSYVQTIENSPEVMRVMGIFNGMIREYLALSSISQTFLNSAETTEARKATLMDAIIQFKTEVEAAIGAEMHSNLIDRILYQIANNELDLNYPFTKALYKATRGLSQDELREYVSNQVLSLLQLRVTRTIDKYKQPFLSSINSFVVGPSSSTPPVPTYQPIAQSLNDFIREAETTVLGFPVTSRDQIFVLEQHLSLHVPFLSRQVAIHAMKLDLFPEEADIKQFYMTLNNLFWKNYAPVLGETTVEGLRSTVDFQIQGAGLAVPHTV